MDQNAAVEAALDNLRPSLAADGFALRAGGWTGSATVDVVLEAKLNVCLDCLVPDEMLVQMIETAIRKQDVAVDRVNLVKEGFDNPGTH